MAPLWDDLKGAFDRFSGGEDANNDDSEIEKMMQADAAPESNDQDVHMVECAKLGRRLPGLERPPFPGELGRRVYEHISAPAWEMWQEHQTLVINHYGLNLADPQARGLLMQEMEAFLFEDQVEVPDDWVPEDQAPGGPAPVPGPQGKGGAPPGPQGKGGGPPGPQRK